jgi:hypothetical protein
MLDHFYLGKIYERTDRPALALGEYQEFLWHFKDSRATLPQIPEARAAVKRLAVQQQIKPAG